MGISKYYIGKEDFDVPVNPLYPDTFDRKTSLGGTITLRQIPNIWMGFQGGIINALYYATDPQTDLNLTTINAALSAIGSSNRGLYCEPGTWDIDDNATIPANVTLICPQGCQLQVAAGKTLTIAGPIRAGAYQIFTGTGTVTRTGIALDYKFAQWDNATGKGLFFPQMQGFVNRPKFEWKDADEVYVYPGAYHHAGTVEQIVYWESKLEFQFLNLGASDWSYLYLDDSAIVTAKTNLLTISELVDSITEPSWSSTKHGWYNGDDRCIFAILTDGGSNILEFFHDEDLILYADYISDVTNQDVDNAWEDAESAFTIPKFCTKAFVTFDHHYDDGNSCAFWRTNGQTGSTGHIVASVTANNVEHFSTMPVITDSSQLIELKHDLSNANTTSIVTDGWYFPIGM